MQWHVLHVRPRCEKKVAESARLLRVDHYLPLRRETKIYQRRKVTVDKPVFPGYVFAAFDQEGRVAVLKTNQVIRILEVRDQELLLRQLAQVRQALAVDPTLSACAALKCGRVVRIRSGPFMGLEGVVASLKGPAKVVLNVEMIGQAVAVEVDRDYLDVVD